MRERERVRDLADTLGIAWWTVVTEGLFKRAFVYCSCSFKLRFCYTSTRWYEMQQVVFLHAGRLSKHAWKQRRCLSTRMLSTTSVFSSVRPVLICELCFKDEPTKSK